MLEIGHSGISARIHANAENRARIILRINIAPFHIHFAFESWQFHLAAKNKQTNRSTEFVNRSLINLSTLVLSGLKFALNEATSFPSEAPPHHETS